MGVIDDAVLPYEVVPAIKGHELTSFASEGGPSFAGLHTSAFTFAMNKRRYDRLPDELKRVIDANSGPETSAWIGRVWDEANAPARQMLIDNGNPINVIPAEEHRAGDRHDLLRAARRGHPERLPGAEPFANGIGRLGERKRPAAAGRAFRHLRDPAGARLHHGRPVDDYPDRAYLLPGHQSVSDEAARVTRHNEQPRPQGHRGS